MKQELIQDIAGIVAEEFGIEKSLLFGGKSSDYVSDARHIFRITLYNLGMSMQSVGAAVGKDHTTIVHSNKVFISLYDTEQLFKLRADSIRKKVLSLMFDNKNEDHA